VEAFFAENRLIPAISREPRCVRWKTEALDILCGDFFELQRDDIGSCQGVYDRAALIALPPAMRARYVNHLSTLLVRQVRGLLLTMDYDQSEMEGPPFSVSDEEVSRLYADTCTVQQLSRTDILHSQPGFMERGLTRLSEQAWRLEWTG
jgi:thiopurine S-methyltransferase